MCTKLTLVKASQKRQKKITVTLNEFKSPMQLSNFITIAQTALNEALSIGGKNVYLKHLCLC